MQDDAILEAVLAPLKSLDISGWDLSNRASAHSMFSDCKALESLKASNLKPCKDLQFMFYGCESLKHIDLSGWDTSKVKNMSGMFYGCSSLTSLKTGEEWKTPKNSKPDFPVAMVDEEGTVHYADEHIPGGAHTYTVANQLSLTTGGPGT